jgi:hypothetical protein
MPVFYGPYSQRGHGLGSFLGSLAKKAMPLLKEVGRRVVQTGLQVAGDVIKGRNIKQSVTSRAREAAKQAGYDTIGKLKRDILGHDEEEEVPRRTRKRQRQAKPNTKTRQNRSKKIKRRGKATKTRRQPSASGDIFD